MRGWLRKIDGPSEPRVVEARHPAVIRALAAFESKEGDVVYVGDDDGTCWRYPLGRGDLPREGRRLSGAFDRPVRDIAVDAKGSWLAVSATGAIGYEGFRFDPQRLHGERLVACGFLRNRDAESVACVVTGAGRVLPPDGEEPPGQHGELTAVATDVDREYLWLGYRSGVVTRFSLTSGFTASLAANPKHTSAVLAIAPLPDPLGDALSGDLAGEVKHQSVQVEGRTSGFGVGGAVVAIAPLRIDGKPHVAVARRPARSTDDRITATDEVTVWAWGSGGEATEDETPLYRLRLNDSVVRMAALPGGRLAIALADGVVRLWRPGRDPKGEFSRPISRHTSPVSAMVVLPGGRVISAAGRSLAMWVPYGGELKDPDPTSDRVTALDSRKVVPDVSLIGTLDGRVGLEFHPSLSRGGSTAPITGRSRSENVNEPLVYRAGESVVDVQWDPNRWTIRARLEGGDEVKLRFEPWASEVPSGPTLADRIREGRVDRRGLVDVLRKLAAKPVPGVRDAPNFVRHTPDAVYFPEGTGEPVLYPHPGGSLTAEDVALLYAHSCLIIDKKQGDALATLGDLSKRLRVREQACLGKVWDASQKARRGGLAFAAALSEPGLMSAMETSSGRTGVETSRSSAKEPAIAFLDEILEAIEGGNEDQPKQSVPEPMGEGSPTILVFGAVCYAKGTQAVTEAWKASGSLGSLVFEDDGTYWEAVETEPSVSWVKSAALVVLLVGERLAAGITANSMSREAGDEEADSSSLVSGEVVYQNTPTYLVFNEALRLTRRCLVYELPLPESNPRIDFAATCFLDEAREVGQRDPRVGLVAEPEALKAELRVFFKRASSGSKAVPRDSSPAVEEPGPPVQVAPAPGSDVPPAADPRDLSPAVEEPGPPVQVAPAPGSDVPPAADGELERRYREDWVGVECGTIRLPLGRRQGLPVVALEDVYVRLRGEPTEVYRRRMEREQWRSIQSQLSLARRELSEEEFRARRRRLLQGLSVGSVGAEVAGKSVELGEAVLRQPAMVILGDPGSGKTTLLKWVALQVAKGTGELGAGGRLPVFVRVSDFAGRLAEETAKHKPYSLETYLRTALRPPKEKLPTAKEVGPLVSGALREGRAVVLLDGLDELGTGLRGDNSRGAVSREDVLRHIEEFLEDWIDPGRKAERDGNKLVVTSRVAGYNAAPLCGPAVNHYTIEPMDEEAIARFCDKWCEALKRPELKDGLTAALLDPKNPRVRELATNPLLVSILAGVFSEEQRKLPDNRVTLYRKTLDYLLKNSERFELEKRGAAERSLGRLAYVLHDRYPSGLIGRDDFDDVAKDIRKSIDDPAEQTFFAQPDLLRILTEEIGLLAERGDELYGFLHLTFQEFLAAQHLIAERKSDAVRERLEEPRWREPLLMALGSTQYWDPKNREGFLVALLGADQVPRNAHLPPPGALLVAAALPEFPRDVSVSAEVIKETADQLLSAADPRRLARFPDLRRKIEEALLTLRERNRKELDEALVRALGDEARAAVTAAFLRPLGWFSEAVVVALMNALPHDDEGLGWPIERCLQELASPEVPTVVPPRPKPAGDDDPDEKPEQRGRRRARRHISERLWRNDERRRAQRERHDLGGLLDMLPFRRALDREPHLVARIRSDPMWLGVVAALYGGYADARAEEINVEYRSLAMFLQRSDQARERIIDLNPEPFLAIGGPDDPIYQIAVYLDLKQTVELPDGTKVSRQLLARRTPTFEPSAIYRDRHPDVTNLLIEALKENYDRVRLGGALHELWEARGEAAPDAILALAALGDERVPTLLADAEAALRLLSRSAAALRDAVYRLANVQRFERLTFTQAGTHEGTVLALKALPDGRLASGSADKTVRIWDLRAPADEQRPPLQGHEDAVWALDVLADGRLASGSADTTIRAWDLRRIEGDPQVLGSHDGAVFALKALADGRLASGSADMTVRVWDFEGGPFEVIGRHEGALVASLDELPDGRLVSGSYDRTVRIWSSPEGEPPALPKNVPAGGGRPVLGRILEWFGLQEPDRGRPADRSTRSTHGARVQVVVGLPDGRVAFGDVDHTLCVWGPDFRQSPRRLGQHEGAVYALKALSDGRLATGSADMTVRLWNPDRGEDSSALIGYHDGAVCSLEVLSDGRIATGSADKSGRVWSRPDASGPPPTFWDQLASLAAGTERDVAAAEAVLKALVRSARLPVRWPNPLIRAARRPLRQALIADGWYVTTLGMGDDAAYDLAVLADSLPPGEELTAAILAAARSPNRRWGRHAPRWEIETVPPLRKSATTVPLEVLHAIDSLDLSHFRPDLELSLQMEAIRKLALHREHSTDLRKHSAELRTFARWISPVVLRAVWPDASLNASDQLDQLKASDDPADRARGLLWLADTPGMTADAGRELRAKAEGEIANVADPFEKLRCYELLLAHSLTAEREGYLSAALAIVRLLEDEPLEQARALARISRFARPDQVLALVNDAIAAVEKATPAARVETLRMLRDEFRDTPTLLHRIDGAIGSLKDAWDRAVATDLLGYHLIARPPEALSDAVAETPGTWTPALLLGGFLELLDRSRQTGRLDALWKNRDWEALLERGAKDGGLALTTDAVKAIEDAWPNSTTLVRDVLGLLVDPQPGVKNNLERWRGRDDLLAAAATLFVAEPTREFGTEDFDRLARLLDADDDRLRFRTLLLLWSSVWSVQKEARGLSVKERGREWVEAFVQRSLDASRGAIASSFTTMFGDLLHDDPDALRGWADAAAGGDPVATVILINVERMTEEVLKVFCKLIEEGPPAARPALLMAACGMSVVERGQKQGQPASLPAAIKAILNIDPKGPELQTPRLLIDAVDSVVSVLDEVSQQRAPDLDEAERSLEGRTTTFGEILADDKWGKSLRPRLESLGNEFYSFLDGSDPHIERGVAAYIAPEAPVKDINDRIQTLLLWMIRSLKRRDPRSGTPAKILQDYAHPLLGVLLRLGGEVARRFPAPFREAAKNLPLEEADLIKAFEVRGRRERRAVVTMLGVLGRATTKTIDVLGRAARDHNPHVSTAAFEAASRLALDLDSDPEKVLDLLSKALDHPSAQTARWAAHALSALGRHPDLSSASRRAILGSLATALEKPQARRWVFEFRGQGNSQDDAVRIEPVERLDQAFLQAYLSVAGLI